MSINPFKKILFDSIYDIQAIRSAQIASGAIIVLDHLITLDEEVDLIWNSPWSIPKGLFFVNRYYGLVSVIVNYYALFSPHLTNSLSPVFLLARMYWTNCMISQVILQMRLYALYSLNKIVLIIMAICFILSTAASATVMGTVLSKITAAAVKPIPDIIFCVPTGISQHFYAFWIPILAFETLLCGLALYKGFATSASAFHAGRRLIAILVRDSVLYFLVMFATYLTNLLVWIYGPPNLLEIPIGFSVAMSCVMGSRIILNVRQVNRDSEVERSLPRKVASNNAESSATGASYRSIIIPRDGTLTEFEMLQLRSLRVEPR